MSELKTFPHDDQFPANVNPTEDNRRKFSEDFDKAQKDVAQGSEPEALIGDGDPKLAEDDKPKPKRQTSTASKD